MSHDSQLLVSDPTHAPVEPRQILPPTGMPGTQTVAETDNLSGKIPRNPVIRALLCVWYTAREFRIMAPACCCCSPCSACTCFKSLFRFRDQHVTWFNPDAPFVSGRLRHIDWRPFHVTCHVDLTPFIATLPRSKYAVLLQRLRRCVDAKVMYVASRHDGKCKKRSRSVGAVLLAICVRHSVTFRRFCGRAQSKRTERTAYYYSLI